jgi:hypothetical protein
MARGILKWSVAAGSVISLLVALQAPAAAAQRRAPAPRVEFAETSFDFGTIYQGEDVSHTFVFRNTGNAPLKIEKVRSTCGCAPALPAKQEIAPGEESSIEVTFRAGLMRGRITKHILVDTNDPIERRVDLTVTVEVKVEIELVPHGIYIGKLAIGDALKRSIDLYSPEVPSFTILDVVADHPGVHVSAPVAVGGKRNHYRLHVEFGPVEEAGRVNAKVVIQTDLPHCKELVVRVYGTVVERGRLSEPIDQG